MADVDAFPLAWPEGWPRTPHSQRESDDRFGGRTYPLTLDRARRKLMHDLELLGAKNVVLSTNVKLRLDGEPYGAGKPINDDPGIAVYFTLKKRTLVMARDRFRTVAGNVRSLGLAIEGMRQLHRHGGESMMERAFTGFLAITPPDWKKPWREVMGYKPGDDLLLPEVQMRFRTLARYRHPDSGGSKHLMAELNLAWEEAKRELST